MSKSIQLKNIDDEKMYPNPYLPVGSIYLSVVDTNPTKWFGGTWEKIAQGKTLVGVDTSDSDFNTVKKTGGSKTISYTPAGTVKGHAITQEELPQRTMVRQYITGTKYGSTSYGAITNNWGNICLADGGFSSDYEHTHGFSGTSATLNKVQPYFTCYIWCRTA